MSLVSTLHKTHPFQPLKGKCRSTVNYRYHGLLQHHNLITERVRNSGSYNPNPITAACEGELTVAVDDATTSLSPQMSLQLMSITFVK